MFTFSMFKDSFGIFVMFVNMGMCEITLIKSESAVYLVPWSHFYWVIKLLMWSANYCFGMHAYVWWRIRSAINMKEGGGKGFPCPFLKIEKITLIIGKMDEKWWDVYRNALILRNLSCPVKFLVAHLRIVFTLENELTFKSWLYCTW